MTGAMQPQELSVTSTTDAANGVTVVRVVGDARLGTIAELQRHMTRIVAGHPKKVVLDLSGLQFIASLAMGTLIAFSSSTKGHGGRVLLAGPKGDVMHALLRARVDAVMPIFDDAKKAAESFNDSAHVLPVS
jgi:anti-anti-sigma factor